MSPVLYGARSRELRSGPQGYQLGCVHATAILRMVAELATVPMRDCWPGAQQPTAQPEGPGARPPEGPAASGRVVLDEGQLLVRAISVRAAFGGMAGDVSMLRSFAALWQRRWACCSHWNRSLPCLGSGVTKLRGAPGAARCTC